jgi:hypothetical protein
MIAKTKRFRTPKLKDGELRVYWGKLPHDSPDVVFSWQGDRSMRRDTALLCYLFSKKEPGTSRGLLEELEYRGYDITTLRLSIMKKTVREDAEVSVEVFPV